MRAITQYEADDGSIHASERECRRHEAWLAGRVHECPKCQTSGTVRGDPISEQVRDRDAEGYLGQFAWPCFKTVIVGYQKVPCDVCDGIGWTAEPKRAITKTQIVGYE